MNRAFVGYGKNGLVIVFFYSIVRRVNGKDIIAKLKAAGWSVDRVNGSHHIMVKEGRAVPVPVHGNKDVGTSLVSAIARQSGVKLK